MHAVLRKTSVEKIDLDVKPYVDEREAETLEKGARLADDYTWIHKFSFVNKVNP